MHRYLILEGTDRKTGKKVAFWYKDHEVCAITTNRILQTAKQFPDKPQYSPTQLSVDKEFNTFEELQQHDQHFRTHYLCPSLEDFLGRIRTREDEWEANGWYGKD